MEAAVSAVPVDEVDLQDPVTLSARAIFSSHWTVRPRCDVGIDLVAGDLLMRKLANEVPGDHAAELPAVPLAQGDDVVEQVLARDVRMLEASSAMTRSGGLSRAVSRVFAPARTNSRLSTSSKSCAAFTWALSSPLTRMFSSTPAFSTGSMLVPNFGLFAVGGRA